MAHFRRSRTAKGWSTAVGADGKGWPDLFLCHIDRRMVIARELKVPPNKLTAEQVVWLHTLNCVGIDAKVWTPSDWAEIERTLGERDE